MSKTLTDTLAGIKDIFPSAPFQPTALDTGVAERLRDMAEEIETGMSRITHFALTVDDNNKKELHLKVE